MKTALRRIGTAFVIVAATLAMALAQDGTLKLSNAEAVMAAITKVQPDYPIMAQQLHLEGAVEVEARIGEDGAVESVKRIRGNEVLSDAAMAATRQWKFTPFMVGDKAVKAVAELTFKFKL